MKITYKVILLSLMFTQLILLGCHSYIQRKNISQNEPDTVIAMSDSVAKFINSDSKTKHNFNFLDYRKDFIIICKNSLNEKGIPKCLYETDIDLKFDMSKASLHWVAFSSLRLDLFKQINDTIILRNIIQEPYFRTQFTQDKIHRKYIPSDFYNNYELAILRLKEIREGLDTLSKINFR